MHHRNDMPQSDCCPRLLIPASAVGRCLLRKEAVYIYVQKNQAYLLNESMDAAWSLLSSALPAASLHDCRK